MTHHQKIWEAGLELSKTKPAFTLEDLAVKCWELHPKEFTMRGHNYPDTRKLATHMYGKSSLLKRGSIIKATNNTYSIGAEPVNEPRKVTIPTDAAWLERQLKTKAAQKMMGDIKGAINTLDVLEFLEIRSIKSPNHLEHLSIVKARLRKIEIHGNSNQGQINFLNAVVDKITPIVHKLDKIGGV